MPAFAADCGIVARHRTIRMDATADARERMLKSDRSVLDMTT